MKLWELGLDSIREFLKLSDELEIYIYDDNV